MAKSIQEKGGIARAKSLTKEERTDIARRQRRHVGRCQKNEAGYSEARSQGVLPIGDVEIDCYVLKDGRRLIAKRAMARAIGLKSDGGNAFLKTLSGKTIEKTAIPEDLWAKINKPVVFKPLAGDPAHGFEAILLIEVCDALIDAKDRLVRLQKFLARRPKIIIRSAAKIGIIALIDEATGFIEDKRKEEYRELWRGYIRAEIRKWESGVPGHLFTCSTMFMVSGGSIPTRPSTRNSLASCYGNISTSHSPTRTARSSESLDERTRPFIPTATAALSCSNS